MRLIVVHPYRPILDHICFQLRIGCENVDGYITIEEARRAFEEEVPDGMIISATVLRQSDGYCLAKGLLEADQPYKGKIVGIVEDGVGLFERFKALGCLVRDNHQGAVSAIQEAFALAH